MDNKAEQVAETKAELKRHTRVYIMSSNINIILGQKWLYLECTQYAQAPLHIQFGRPRKTPVKQCSDSQASPTTSTAISPASHTMEL